MEITVREFIKAAEEVLTALKQEEPVQPINSSSFPVLDKQHNWKFARSNNKLLLHDGNVIHTFSMEHFNTHADFPMTKEEDTNYFDFKKDMPHSGTAQVHKANPGMIHVTLHDGVENPTLTLMQENEHSWKAIPKVKHKTAFDLGATIENLGNSGLDAVRSIGTNPWLSAGIGLGIGGAYDLGRRTFYNTDEENEEETTGERAARWLLPAAGLGLGGWAMRTAIPGYYQHPTMNSANNPDMRVPDQLMNKEERKINVIDQQAKGNVPIPRPEATATASSGIDGTSSGSVSQPPVQANTSQQAGAAGAAKALNKVHQTGTITVDGKPVAMRQYLDQEKARQEADPLFLNAPKPGVTNPRQQAEMIVRNNPQKNNQYR